MSIFRYSICDPLLKDPIEMGEIESHKMADVLNRFPWNDLFEKMKAAADNEVHFSPSLEFENITTRHALAISLVEGGVVNEFYIFYKRPKTVTKLFGLIKNKVDDYTSDRTGQTLQDVTDAVNALAADDLNTLEKRWG